MKILKTTLFLAGIVAVAFGLTEKEEQVVTDVLTILKRGTSIYPLEDIMHQLSSAMGFNKSARILNRFVPGGTTAYATVYDMLIYVDANGKHSLEQREKLKQLIDVIGTKILKLNEKEVSFRTLIVQEEEDDGERNSKASNLHLGNIGEFGNEYERKAKAK
ncbi:hypothetical protein LPJ64_006125 [Coemansia asiatica]|uniref:Uncharacterized protein n=1 Tax=Coemansia asiatica TaxID=1052880 RepID=A0A9W7XD29_9FUNG|nr:hypothetical protein LPJ64_006125 [Coemansia asiatica]